MLKEVYFALSVSSSAITGQFYEVDQLHVVDNSPIITKPHSHNLRESCERCIAHMLRISQEQQFSPTAIGVSTKGQIKDNGNIVFISQQNIPLKQHLETRFKLPTYLLNRFQALTLGVYQELENKPTSLAVILLSDGVGFGFVKDAKILNTYDSQNGAGGLAVVKRASDKRYMKISQIAGASGFGSLGMSINECFEKQVKDDSAYAHIRDARYAVVDLLKNLTKTHNPQTIYIHAYAKQGCSAKHSAHFIKDIEQSYNREQDSPLVLHNASHLHEEETKCKGVAAYIQHASLTVSAVNTKRPLDRTPCKQSFLFVITGEPTSGKTTFIQQSILPYLTAQDLTVGGMFTREVRNASHRRVGFESVLFASGEQNLTVEFATMNPPANFTDQQYKLFSRTPYYVNVQNIQTTLIPKLREIEEKSDVLVIDEVAAMQLLSYDFERLMKSFLSLSKPLFITVPFESKNKLVNEIKNTARASDQFFQLQVRDKTRSQYIAAEKIRTQAMRLLGGIKHNLHESVPDDQEQPHTKKQRRGE